ncbi:phosphate acyltransferase PlsX [Granulosicoccaceae sp. 1_MG-2023]|nr:phosphate acyltransferase PlsX [Granulosicoccaceae sp. 1_MG-2023]
MNDSVTIAIDAMGGDIGAEVVVHAVKLTMDRQPRLKVILVGDETVVKAEMAKHDLHIGERLSLHHCTEVVQMDDPPSVALRSKKDSSMRVAINLVKEQQAEAAVSAGNTGALMAISRFVLKTLPNIDRPALCTTLPARHGHTHMLDLGANLDCTAEHLMQFAVMGSTLAEAVDNVKSPRVGLLNIGAEEIKGNDQVKHAAKLIAASNVNYIGFVEGNEIYAEHVDVVVCDGFVGNVALKTSEGLASMIGYYLRDTFKSSWYGKLAGLLALPIIKTFINRIDWRRYNGASLLGLKGIVVKSHGSADASAYSHAIEVAMIEVAKNVPNMIEQHLQPLLRSEATQ